MIICLSRSGAGLYPSLRLAAGRDKGWGAAADTVYECDSSVSLSFPTPAHPAFPAIGAERGMFAP